MGKKIALLLFLMFSMTALVADAGVYAGKVTCVYNKLREYCMDYNGKPLKGKAVIRTDEGKVLNVGNFRRGYRSGYSRFYDENGYLQRVSVYRHGIKNGKESLYYPNGKVQLTARYRNGKISGSVKQNDIYGKKAGEFYYKKGKLKRGYCIGTDKRRYNISDAQVRLSGFNSYMFCRAK